MNDRPSIGEPVVLRDGDGLVYSSRVEDVGDDAIAIARPADLRAAIEYVDGMEFELVWTLASGIHVLPVVLDGSSVDNRIRLWHLAVAGEGWTEQRRDYVRVPASGRIVIEADDPDADLSTDDAAAADPAWRIDGHLVDLSEVAAQCTLPVATDDERIRAGSAIRCRFGVNGVEFDLRGTIAVVRSGTGAKDTRVVILFTATRATSDALRKQVFAVQVAMRRDRGG